LDLLPLRDPLGFFVEVDDPFRIRRTASHITRLDERHVIIPVKARNFVETQLRVFVGLVLLDEGDGIAVLLEVLAEVKEHRALGVGG